MGSAASQRFPITPDLSEVHRMNDRGLSIFDEEPDETETPAGATNLQKGSSAASPDGERTQVIPAVAPSDDPTQVRATQQQPPVREVEDLVVVLPDVQHAGARQPVAVRVARHQNSPSAYEVTGA